MLKYPASAIVSDKIIASVCYYEIFLYWEGMAVLSFATLPFYGVRIGAVLAGLKSVILSRLCDLVVLCYVSCAH